MHQCLASSQSLRGVLDYQLSDEISGPITGYGIGSCDGKWGGPHAFSTSSQTISSAAYQTTMHALVVILAADALDHRDTC